MSQPQYGFTVWGTQGTSTGAIQLSTGPTTLHTVNILSSGTGSIILYNGTASSTSNHFAVINPGVPKLHLFDAVLPSGLMRGNTTSTAEVTVTWG